MKFWSLNWSLNICFANVQSVSTLIVTMFPARERLCFSRSANYLSICGKFCHAGMVVTVTKSLVTFVTVCHGIPELVTLSVKRISSCHYTTGTGTTNVWSPSATVFSSASRRRGAIIAGRDNFVTWTRMSCRNRDWQLYTLFTSSCIQIKLVASCCWTGPRLANLRLIVYGNN